MTTFMFDPTPEKKEELARKVMARSCEGHRATSGVATKEQIGLVMNKLQSKAESVHFTYADSGIPGFSQHYTLDKFEQMETMNPENWVAPKHMIEEYLDISAFPMLDTICEVPKIIRIQLCRECDTVEMRVTFYLKNRAIQIFLEPGVTMLNLQESPLIAIKPDEEIEPNIVLGNGRELYILPDERSKVVEVLNHNAKVEMLDQQDGFDTDTGVEWVHVRTQSNNFGWMPKAAISQFHPVFGNPVVDCQKHIDCTLRTSIIYCSDDSEKEILNIQKQSLAATFEQLLASQLQKYLTAVAISQLRTN